MNKFTNQLVTLVLICCLTPLTATAGFNIQNGQLIDAKGNPFIIRGINHAHNWWPQYTVQALEDIADTGANSVRVVLATGQRWGRNSGSELANIIQMCKENKLIAILEVHDSTGWPEQSGAAPLSSSVGYWLSTDILNAIRGQEDYVIINIANEPFGNGVAASTWTNEHVNAIQRMRQAGITHTLMVDAGNWGQDWQYIMRDNASSVFNSDPDRNVIFSVHMYEVYSNLGTVRSYMQSFATNRLPLVVGEFASDHYGQNVDEAAIMSQAQQFGFGYLGWSWAGNSSNLSYLDIAVNWNPNVLSNWGNRLINGSNGIAQTSKIASVFVDDAPSSNLALNKPTEVSSIDGYAGDGNSAVDSNPGTRWASAWSDPQWIQVDLQGTYNINRVVLNWEAAYGEAYQIQVSDDANNWRTIFSTNNGNGGVDELNVSGQGRYLRMLGSRRGSRWGYSLWEFEAYGSPGTPTPPPTPSRWEAEDASLSDVTVENNG